MPRHPDVILASIKQNVDIVALAGDYGLALHRAGSKFKALCPFHDDHNPSLELNPDRQTYKCWSCGAGGDVFDFVVAFDRVEFPEALRMLAERAGIALETAEDRADSPSSGPSKSDLLAVMAWAEAEFAAALRNSGEARDYLESRGIAAEMIERFRLGFAPDSRDWLSGRARRPGFGLPALEAAGLVARAEDSNLTRDRFRGRLIFPIHDSRGRAIAFGGRILPEIEKKLAESGRGIAKYLNSPETVLFQKRRNLYGADLARDPSRKAGWVAVVEGYTDVIAAHQVGLSNVVGTLGTALGDDHVNALRRLADRVVLVFDGDEAGQKAADRSLEIFLGHEVDLRVMTLPAGLDPCDFLIAEGAEPFRSLVDSAADPLEFAIDRARSRFDFESAEGARQAADWVLAILAKIPPRASGGLEMKSAKALDILSRLLNVSVLDLNRRLRQLRKPAPAAHRADPAATLAAAPPIQIRDLDRTDVELIRIVLNEPGVVPRIVSRIAVSDLRDAPLRTILAAAYDVHAGGSAPEFSRISSRLGEAERSLAAGLLLPVDSSPFSEAVRPAPLAEQLPRLLTAFAARELDERRRDVQGALQETDPVSHPDEHRALLAEYMRLLMTPRPDPRKTIAS